MRLFPTLAAAILPALILSTPLRADDYADRVAVAKEVAEVSLAAIDLDALIATMWKPITDQAAARGTPLSEAQKSEINALYLETFRGPMTDLMLGQDALMAELMTMEELVALRDFYSTDAGRSVMSKLPKVMEAQQPQIMQLIQSTMPVLLPKVMAVIQPPTNAQ